MTKNIDSRKYELIKKIMELSNEEDVSRVEKELRVIFHDEIFWDAVKPTREGVSIDQMIEEQGYKPLEKETFLKKIRELNIEEPVEDLLAMLD